MKLSSIANMVSGAKGVERTQEPSYTVPFSGETTEAVVPVTNIEDSRIGQDRAGNPLKEEVSEAEADRRMKSVIDQANNKVKHSGNRQLAFSYNENTKRISIKVYDAVTKEIIREIPPEKTLEMLERVYDLAGIMVDEKR